MVWSAMIEEVRGMAGVAGATGIWHPGTDYRSLSVANGRSFQHYRSGSLIVTGLATVGCVDADQEIRVGMTAQAAVTGGNDAG